jgi:hypothetical protein
MRKLARFLALTAPERRALVEATLLLPVAATTLRLAGMHATRRLLERYANSPRLQGSIDAAGVARMVAIAVRYGAVRARCLPAALTLEALLRRRGLAGELRLGVRKHEGRFEAHAWVEHEGAALMEPARSHSRFVAFEGPAPGR